MTDEREKEAQAIAAADVGPLPVGVVGGPVPVGVASGGVDMFVGVAGGWGPAPGIWSLFERMQGEIAREIRVLLGEEQYDQRIFTEHERMRRVLAMQVCAEAPDMTPADRHDAWCKMHLDSGWTYGPEFKPSEKQHPNLQPWAELPAATRSKAAIFEIVARYGRQVVTLGEFWT